MKRLICLLVLLPLLLFGQDPVWDKNQFNEARPGWDATDKQFELYGLVGLATDIEDYETTYNSKHLFTLDRSNMSSGDYNGLFALTAVFDSVAADSTDEEGDTLRFYPVYDLGPGVGWFVGDLIPWTLVDSDTSADSTLTLVVPQRDHGNVFYWATDPTTTGMVGNVPVKRYYIRMIATGDTVGANVRMSWFKY